MTNGIGAPERGVGRRENVITRRVALLAMLAASTALAQGNGSLDLSRLVVVGDSLSAGFQNYSLLDTQQVHGYASVLAQQAGVPLVLPLVPAPGVPNVLHLVSPGPPPVVATVEGSLPPIPRDNPNQQATNLAVPGMYVADVLNKRPNPNVQNAIDGLTNVILGFPSPFLDGGPSRSQVEWAAALNPTAIVVWIGSNDILLSAMTGDPSLLTPLPSFTKSYFTMMDALSKTGAKLIVANLPDITIAPYFTSVSQLSAMTGVPVGRAASMLGTGTRDYVRPGGVPLAFQILEGEANGPLPAMCPAAIQGLPVTETPCVFTAWQAMLAHANVDAFNLVIAGAAALHRATLVDTYSLVNQLSQHGYVANGYQLTTDFLGGLITLDGIHPTNTLHAIIANQFITTLNHTYRTKIPTVSVDQVAATDPLVIPAFLKPAR
jgi:hypothetical protein